MFFLQQKDEEVQSSLFGLNLVFQCIGLNTFPLLTNPVYSKTLGFNLNSLNGMSILLL